MSERGIRGNVSFAAKAGATFGQFRCIYCRQRHLRRMDLRAHEAMCTSREVRQLHWMWGLERFKARLRRVA